MTRHRGLSITGDEDAEKFQITISRQVAEDAINRLLDGERVDRIKLERGFSVDRNDIANIIYKITQRVSSQNRLLDSRVIFITKFSNNLTAERRDVALFKGEDLAGKEEILEIEARLTFFIGFDRAEFGNTTESLSYEKQVVFIIFFSKDNKKIENRKNIEHSYIEYGVESTDFSWPNDIMGLISDSISEILYLYKPLSKFEELSANIFGFIKSTSQLVVMTFMIIFMALFSYYIVILEEKRI